jgi:hypothetical protein
MTTSYSSRRSPYGNNSCGWKFAILFGEATAMLRVIVVIVVSLCAFVPTPRSPDGGYSK